MDKLYTVIKEKYLSDYKGDNIIIKTKNVIFQISILSEQKEDIPNVSNINLGGCEKTLKENNEIPDSIYLVVFKIDIKTKELVQTYVQYELYDPRNMTILDLSICDKISIDTPIELDSSTSDLYDNLKESGYDLFNESDPFYNDICSIYTSENGTDMTLNDRRKEIFDSSGNIPLCQTGCEIDYYNSTSKKAKCECSPQIKAIIDTNLSSSDSKFIIKSIPFSFMTTLQNSNFLLFKCFQLVFNFNNFFSNIGRTFMLVVILFSITSLVFFCVDDNKKIETFIQLILKNKLSIQNKTRKKVKKRKIHKSSKFKIKNKDKKKKDNPPKKTIFTSNIKKKKKYKKSHFKNSINTNEKFQETNVINNNTNINIVKVSNYIMSDLKNNTEKNKPEIRNKNKELKNSRTKTRNESSFKTKNNTASNSKATSNFLFNSKNKLKKLNAKSINNDNYNNLNDQELNSLEYETAIVIDKRTYFQYYWSLLKKKQLILFTFFPQQDYNLISIKICLFLISFSLYFTFAAFFFSDETMHKIHKENGVFNIITQIQQILFSSFITYIIYMVLRQLSLSEKNFLDLKKLNKKKEFEESAKNIKECLAIKFIFFFILDFIFLIICWYYISCFCAVYKNTQILLIEDTIISFGLSMLYPFGLNLLPGIFRIPALKDQNKDKKCLYFFSNLVALI